MSAIIVYRDKFSKRRKVMRTTAGFAQEYADRLRIYGHAVMEIRMEA